MRDELIQRLRDEADLCRAETADDIARLLDEAAAALDLQSKEAARYHWMRAAWLEGVEDDTDPVAQQAIGMVQNEAEMDAVIDAQIAAGKWPQRP